MKKAFSIPGKFIIGILLGLLIAYIYDVLNPNYIIVRIVDNTNCKSISYSVEFKYKSVTISGDQIKTLNTGMVGKMDIMLIISPNKFSDKKITYKVRAKYEDCAEIVSDERNVKLGWGLYEWIDNNKIRHEVRNK